MLPMPWAYLILGGLFPGVGGVSDIGKGCVPNGNLTQEPDSENQYTNMRTHLIAHGTASWRPFRFDGFQYDNQARCLVHG